MLGVLDRPFLRRASSIDWRIEHFGSRIRERLIVTCDCPSTPVGVPEVRPGLGAIPVIDDDVGDRLDPVVEQRCQHRALLSKITIAVVQVEVSLGIISRAVGAGERRRRQPYQVEASLTYRRGLVSDDLVPRLRAETGELLRMPMSVGFPIKSLQHDSIVIETRLRVNSGRRKPYSDIKQTDESIYQLFLRHCSAHHLSNSCPGGQVPANRVLSQVAVRHSTK